jgi:outer membrane receptor protein involved in Fe transport
MKFKWNLLAGVLFFATMLSAQFSSVTVSGAMKDGAAKTPLAYVNVILKNMPDSSFASGTITGDDGLFTLTGVKPGNYLLQYSYIGYQNTQQQLYVGNLSEYLNLPAIELATTEQQLTTVEITAKQEDIKSTMDKKTFSVENNISQSGGSVLQAMQNLPGVTVQNSKVQLRGNDKVIVMIDGKQTALTGFDNQSGLDNLPASAIDKIEIINNPSAKYDANGNGGIINIVLKKNKQEGFNGKAGLALGAGALWVKKQNLPGIRPQYQFTPKVNPSLAFNYRRKNINAFFEGDYMYKQTLNKNEFVTRTFDNGDVIKQQTKRNRNTHIGTGRVGFDWAINPNNSFTLSALFSAEKIIDNGDEPFYNATLTERRRLWQFIEDELKITTTASAIYQHKFKQPGHTISTGVNYTFHREDEKYSFTNYTPTFTGQDAFKLLSNENVIDYSLDYVRPLKFGRIEAGLKYRWRYIPTDMQFYPGLNSPLDTNAGGWANYYENIPALYGNYVYESKKIELELGMRVEYVNVRYTVDPNHNTYKSDGYQYIQPFPNFRFAWKINDRNKLSLFFNRRVDRPAEFDIRVFPKYDDAEIIKVGNPALRPQYTYSFELGYKTNWKTGYFYAAAFHRLGDGTLTRIRTVVPGSTIVYAIMQNAGRSYNTGLETIISQDITKLFSFNINLVGYHNRFNAFTVVNKYPVTNTFSTSTEQIFSGNAKLNMFFHLPLKFEIQLTAIYLAPDRIPQGKIGQRFTLDFGIKKTIQKGKGELFLNATDLANTMVIKEELRGNGFNYLGYDYYETQVIRLGYTYKF